MPPPMPVPVNLSPVVNNTSGAPLAAKIFCIHEKTLSQKSRDTVPLK
jgi:hypothetical protein